MRANSISTCMNVSMRRRFAAIVYDIFLLFSLLFVMGLIYRLLFGANSIEATGVYFVFYQFYLLGGIMFYFCFPWLKSGQTLGMSSWGIQVVNVDLSMISTRQAFLRFAVAILSWLSLGAGFVYAFFNVERLTWHDKLSKSCLVRVKKPTDRGR